MSYTRLTPTDDDGSGTTGTIWDAAYLTSLYNSLEAATPQGDGCSAFHSTTQSLSDGVATALSLDSEDYDNGTMHSNVTNNSRVTVPASAGGIYHVVANVTFAANATGYRQISIRKNGATTLRTVVNPSNSAGVDGAFTLSAVVVLVAADYLEIVAAQNSGGALNAGSATAALANRLTVARLI